MLISRVARVMWLALLASCHRSHIQYELEKSIAAYREIGKTYPGANAHAAALEARSADDEAAWRIPKLVDFTDGWDSAYGRWIIIEWSGYEVDRVGIDLLIRRRDGHAETMIIRPALTGWSDEIPKCPWLWRGRGTLPDVGKNDQVEVNAIRVEK